MSDRKNHQKCTTRFIDLANELQADGMSKELVNAALMSASGIFATFTAAGNAGALEPSGVDKVVDLYRRNLEHIQVQKKEQVSKGST